MKKGLKQDIIKWLIDNELMFNRVNGCIDHFREYIYDSKGQYLNYGIGEQVINFIEKVDKLLYGGEE